MSLLLALALQTSVPVGVWEIESPRADQKWSNQFFQAFARCLVASTRVDTMARFLRTNPSSPAFDTQVRKIVSPKCMPLRLWESGRVTFRGPIVRGALFEAVYRRTPHHPITIDRSSTEDFPNEFDGDQPIPEDLIAMRSVGDCTVRHDPTAAHLLVMTDSGTAAEEAAVAKIALALQQCRPSGETVRISRSVLRGMLAEALYKLSLPVAGRR